MLSHFSLSKEDVCQSETGESSRVGIDCTGLANSAMVPSSDVMCTPYTCPTQQLYCLTQATRCILLYSETSCMACIRSSLQSQGISREATEIILAFWRHNTKSAYSCNWRRWCHEREYNPLCSTINQILEFLTCEFALGKQYRTLNSYRSALSMTHPTIDGIVVG